MIIKKPLSLVLSLFMVCTLLPVGVFAQQPSPDDIFEEEGVSWRVWYRSEYGGELEAWDDFWVVRSQRNDREEVRVVRYWGDNAEVVVPEGVTHLRDGHFCNTETTKSITLPDSLISLGHETFLYMNHLEKIVIPEKISCVDGFGDSKALSEVILPKNLETIGELAFLRCTSLKHIELPDGLQTIEDGAFEGSGLTEIVIPPSVKLLDNPFAGCENLTKIVVTSPDTALKNFNKYGKTYGTIYAPKGSKAEAAAKKAGIPFKSIALNKTSLSLSKGKTYQLKFNSGSEAVWKSSNSKVVSVSKTGKITAKANGTATITATLYGKKYTCKVTVGAKTYTVKRGDSLWSIAAKQLGNGRRYTEIMKLNGMKSTKIVAGQKLKLPEK